MANRTRGKEPRTGFALEMFVDQEQAALLQCGICWGVLNQPKQCKKGHAHCDGCFDQALENSSKCPSCRIRVISDDLSTSLLVNNLVQRLQVFCKCSIEIDTNKRPGCVWTGTMEDRNLRDCDFLYGSCPHDGCNVTRMRVSKIDNHQKKCPKRPCMCADCGAMFPTETGVLHATMMCPYRKVECDGCGEDVCLNQMDEHKAVQCDLTVIPCVIFEEYGMCVSGCYGTVNKCFALQHLGAETSRVITFMHSRYLTQKKTLSVTNFILFLDC
jgi:hypothetical protein